VGGPPPAAINIRLFDGHPDSNDQIIDHDQTDAFDCTMSYTCARRTFAPPSPPHNSGVPDFCAVCNLTLRFYDRVELQRAANHGNQIMNGQTQVSIAQATLAGSTWTLREAGADGRLPNLTKAAGASHSYEVMAVGREFPPPLNMAALASKARLNLSFASTGAGTPFWTQESTDGGHVILSAVQGPNAYGVVMDNRVRVTGDSPGTVTLKFSRNGLTASATIGVT